MAHLTIARSPEALAHAVKQYHQRYRFLVAVSVPNSMGIGEPNLHLYGSTKACHEAEIEAATDHPGCTKHGEYEYLPNSVISEMVRQSVQNDPVAQAMHSLGRVKPD